MSRLRRAIRVCVVLLSLSSLSSVLAHATLVLGTAAFEASAASTEVVVHLHDPSLVEVEDAIVFLELTALDAPEQRTLSSDRLSEIEPGVYTTSLPHLDAAAYQLRVIDRTFRQEEAIAEVELVLDVAGVGSVAFVLPPTATSQRDLLSWLGWVVGLPLLAGVIVTVLVLRSGPKSKPEEDSSEDGEETA